MLNKTEAILAVKIKIIFCRYRVSEKFYRLFLSGNVRHYPVSVLLFGILFQCAKNNPFFFIIMPLSFLSGVFYSLHSLPPFWQALSRYNPFFYMIDGFRYGFFGQADVAVGVSLAACALFLMLLAGLTWLLLARGYKLRA